MSKVMSLSAASCNMGFALLQVAYDKQVAQLVDLIEIINGDLTKNDRKKLITLCTIDVHARDVVQRLIDERVENMTCFQWQSQLRYYQNEKTKEAQVGSRSPPLNALAWATSLYHLQHQGLTRRCKGLGFPHTAIRQQQASILHAMEVHYVFCPCCNVCPLTIIYCLHRSTSAMPRSSTTTSTSATAAASASHPSPTAATSPSHRRSALSLVAPPPARQVSMIPPLCGSCS